MATRYGTCRVCNGIYSLRKSGVLRAHGYSQFAYGASGPGCAGAGQPPKNDLPDSTEDIARAVAAKLSGGLDHPWAHWRNYHPVVKATVEWLDERNYLAIVTDDDHR